MQQIKKTNPLLDFMTRHFAWIAFGVYASGFLAWNNYLSSYGFVEYSIVQTRFLSAGILMWLPVALVSLAAASIRNKVPQEWSTTRISITVGVVFLALVWFYLLFAVLLTQIPQAFGGVKPIPVSLIGTPDQIDYLANFAVGSGENAQGKHSVQTRPICLIYQNDQYILFFNATQASSSIQKNGDLYLEFAPRVISIARDNFLGFHQVQATENGPDPACGLSGSLYNGRVQVPVAAATK